jgi:hypothetical protein
MGRVRFLARPYFRMISGQKSSPVSHSFMAMERASILGELKLSRHVSLLVRVDEFG